MKKFLLTGAVAALAVMPALTLAASYNDVTLGGTNLNAGGILLTISGTATLNTFVVSGSDLVATLAPGSTITVIAPNLNKLSISPTTGDFLTNLQCNSGGSTLTLTASASDATTSITISPSSTICGADSGGGGGGGGNGPVASGGGGGGGSGAIIPTTPTTPATNSNNTTGTSGSIAGLQAQIQALLAQIASLAGNANPSGSAYANANGNASFKRDLQVGSSGADVKALQVWLNAHGFVIASSGPGSAGNETTSFGGKTKAALAKWQASVGIKPASGYFGAKTRAYLAAHM